MSTSHAPTVLETHHYTDALFSFRTTRPKGFRFRSGEFAMLGLPGENGRPLLRAYSMASPNWSDDLEFFSIKVPKGPLTSRLSKVAPGDSIILRPKSTGTLVLDALLPGKTLWMVSTGTGIAPFASIARDPETYDHFERLILIHTCRHEAELGFGFDLIDRIRSDELLSELVNDKLTYVPSLTREDPSRHGIMRGRVTALVNSGDLFAATQTNPWSTETDRLMICGSTNMLADVKALCETAGLVEGSNSVPGHFAIEKAFAG